MERKGSVSAAWKVRSAKQRVLRIQGVAPQAMCTHSRSDIALNHIAAPSTPLN
jgi:hypothetical protein